MQTFTVVTTISLIHGVLQLTYSQWHSVTWVTIAVQVFLRIVREVLTDFLFVFSLKLACKLLKIVSCKLYVISNASLSLHLVDELFKIFLTYFHNYIEKMEEITGKKFGDKENPLLVSVRSGARASVVIVKPCGTGSPRPVISARLAPLPPRSSSTR